MPTPIARTPRGSVARRVWPGLLTTSAAAGLMAAALAAAQSGSGQPSKPAPQQQERPVIRSEANFVRVDVYPTAGGVPVTDLRAEDFEVFEDNAPQAIQSFEHVVIRPAGPQEERAEPNTVEASRQLAANPRNRVIVLYLDIPHVTMDGAWHSREPLLRLVDRILGPDDLIGIMTPSMTASELVLARKTEVLAAGLRDRWPWGERHTLERTERERMYEACFPWQEAQDVVLEMIDRRRERATLDSLAELVHYLGGIRDDRKAILTVTEGWLLYRPNRDLTRPRVITPAGGTEPIPGPPPIAVGPDGRIALEDKRRHTHASALDCHQDRMTLSAMDNWTYFRDIIDAANRENASFYTVDPRGLPVFDAPVGPRTPPPITVDAANLKTRHDSMHILASNTDGMAVMNSNNLEPAFKRIAADLTSYYLLGYYSTNSKLDGRFRTLKVRVKRPGVDVRARRGYRAATEEEVNAARAAVAVPVPPAVAAVNAALADLSRLRSATPFRINAVPYASSGTVSTVWVAGEVRGADARAGGQVEIKVTGNGTAGTSDVTLAAGQRTFLTTVRLDKPMAGGILEVRARLAGVSLTPVSDIVRVDAGSATARALLFRRGPSTGNRYEPAGDALFARTERIRLDIPAAAGIVAGAGRVLDRAGQPLAVPVTVSERTDADTGIRWISADVTLAPLTLGDYAIEVELSPPGAEKRERVLTAVRVGR